MLPQFEKEAAVRQAATRIVNGKTASAPARTPEKGRAAEHVARVFGIGGRTVTAVKRTEVS